MMDDDSDTNEDGHVDEVHEQFKRFFYSGLALLMNEFGSERVLAEMELIVEHPEILTACERRFDDLRVATDAVMEPAIEEIRDKMEKPD